TSLRPRRVKDRWQTAPPGQLPRPSDQDSWSGLFGSWNWLAETRMPNNGAITNGLRSVLNNCEATHAGDPEVLLASKIARATLRNSKSWIRATMIGGRAASGP